MSRRLAIIEGQRAALAYGSDPGLWHRCKQLERLAAAQAERIRELEAGRPPDALRERNAVRQAESERLRQALAATLADAPHPGTITAKEALRALERAGFDAPPSVRTVQRHLDALRHTVRGARKS